MAEVAEQTAEPEVQMDDAQSKRAPSAEKSAQDASVATEAEPPRPDPDAQTTITDFLDFTEYLPADMMRSLTLIGKLDETYSDASTKVNELTQTWGQLPSLSANDRPSPVQLRADISEQLSQAVSSRVFSHSEAVRMSESVNRHFNKAKLLLSKLQTMMDNYPSEEQQQQLSPTASRSPQMSRAKLASRVGPDGGPKVRQPRIPRVTVPGEVLAPYDIEYDTQSDEEDVSSDDDDTIGRRTPGLIPRIKLVSAKNSRLARPIRPPPPPPSAEAQANLAALLRPPPENAVIGSPDAPWLQLTQYELAKLRKRMKKNAIWTPSETMITRELKTLRRGPDDYLEAKKKAEAEGKVFQPTVPAAVVDEESGTPQLPPGALSLDSITAEEQPTLSRGTKPNEAKKLKREALAKQAAEEAEESARRMKEAAQLWLGGGTPALNAIESAPAQKPVQDSGRKKQRTSSRSHKKRKREDEEVGSEPPESIETPSRPNNKRKKTVTPVPPPPHGQNGGTDNGLQSAPHSQTPVPIPMPRQGSATSAGPAKSPTPTAPTTQTVTTTVPTKPAAPETPLPVPKPDRRKSTTPVAPVIRELPNREGTKRETRGDAAKRSQQQQLPQSDTNVSPQAGPATLERPKRSVSRGVTPAATTPAPEPPPPRRPVSRGTAEPPTISAASDRPRRASTARNTPAPEIRPPSRRTKRPAPGVVSTTSSGGNSAVGKRKAAPRKKARTTRKEKDQIDEVEMEDVDDEGNPIDPDEARYCLCNRVSFGTMIQCDNVDNCKGEWFHLECVGMDDIPARTTKWYCPDCRRALNIGEKGEVSARGVRK